MGNETKRDLTALYYPFSRCLDETTLKRAILLYDHLLFIDPKSQKVRAGLYSVKNHQAFLPENAALAMQQDWESIEDRYGLLADRGVVSFFDPTPLLQKDAIDRTITAHMQTDMGDRQIFDLFSDAPQLWSILRSRIPKSAFPYLTHQYTQRVLYEQNIRGAFHDNGRERRALFSDGIKDQIFGSPSQPSQSPAEVPGEFACVLPYYLGSSLAVSLAQAACVETQAIPFTDSTPHHRLLAIRYRRAAANEESHSGGGIAGLTEPTTQGKAQGLGLVQLRLLDSVLSREDLDALSIEQCLDYRDATAEQRKKFRAYVSQLQARVQETIWSPGLNSELKKIEREALAEYKKQRTDLLDAHLKIFKKAAVGVALSAAPAIVAAVTPQISPVAAIIFGAPAALTLKAPVKELAELWADRLSTQRNALSYLFELKA